MVGTADGVQAIPDHLVDRVLLSGSVYKAGDRQTLAQLDDRHTGHHAALVNAEIVRDA